MMISNNSSFVGAEWEPYLTSKSWTLTGASGINTVYAKFKNYAGMVSIAVFDDIVFDNTPPVVNITKPTEGEEVKVYRQSVSSSSCNVWIYFKATDNAGRVVRIECEGTRREKWLSRGAASYIPDSFVFGIRGGQRWEEWSLMIKAYDEVGNMGYDTVHFTVRCY